jgi:hypothetical protein
MTTLTKNRKTHDNPKKTEKTSLLAAIPISKK